ncbi:hypothetical protein [Leptospira chreensis]|uniref:hypothetical protein n=1 Tax=Leptospira chreensis TaxID=2810035 RepID=UPI0019632862|nr:hypothetical protein [Leptospira chreensis]
MNSSLLLTFVFCLAFIFNCNSDIEKLIEEDMEKREGSPEIVTIDGKFLSAKAFREALIADRKTFEHKFNPATPEEVEQYLSNYIEESILLQRALADVDFNSNEAKDYMARSVRKAAISYWLDKKSGALNLVENSDKIQVDNDILEKFKQSKSNASKLKSVTMDELQREAKIIKLNKLMEAATIKKRLIAGKAKRDAKVQIVPKEVYSSVTR